VRSNKWLHLALARLQWLQHQETSNLVLQVKNNKPPPSASQVTRCENFNRKLHSKDHTTNHTTVLDSKTKLPSEAGSRTLDFLSTNQAYLQYLYFTIIKLEQVDTFPYLGSLITANGKCMTEFHTRLNRRRAIRASLQKLWKVTAYRFQQRYD